MYKMAKVDAYGFSISRMDYQKYSDELRHARGFVGMEENKKGLVCVFDTENNAKICRNIMDFCDTQVGKTVFNVKISKEYMRKQK